MTTQGKDAHSGTNQIMRRAFVAELLNARDRALIVPGLGSATWDCFAAGDSPEYLYSWGGMGLAVPTALGLALAQPDRREPATPDEGPGGVQDLQAGAGRGLNAHRSRPG